MIKYFTLAYILDHPWPVLTSLMLFYVGGMCMLSIVFQVFRDTIAERICIAGISLSALSRASYVYQMEEVPSDFVILTFWMSAYVTVIAWKHFWVIPRRSDYVPKDQMPKY